MTPGGRVNVVGMTRRSVARINRGGRLGAACFAAISWDQEDVQRQKNDIVAFIYASYSSGRHLKNRTMSLRASSRRAASSRRSAPRGKQPRGTSEAISFFERAARLLPLRPIRPARGIFDFATGC